MLFYRCVALFFLGFIQSSIADSCILGPSNDKKSLTERKNQAARVYIEEAEALERKIGTQGLEPWEINELELRIAASFGRAMDCDPKASLSAWYSLADLHLKRQSYDAAGYFAAQGLRQNPNNTDLKLIQSRVDAALGRHQKALQLCKELRKSYPTGGDESTLNDIRQCLIETAFLVDDGSTAREALLELEKNYKETEEKPISTIWFQLGRAFEIGEDKKKYGKGSDLDQASAYYLKAYDHAKRHHWAAFYLSLVFAEKKDFSKALEWTEKFLSDFPRFSVAVYNRACFKARLGQTEDALKDLEYAVQLGFRERKHIMNDPDMESLRALPRFQEILYLLPELPDVPK